MSLFSEAFSFISDFSYNGGCMYVCHDDLYPVLEKLLYMISFESSSEATAIRIRETVDGFIELQSE